MNFKGGVYVVTEEQRKLFLVYALYQTKRFIGIAANQEQVSKLIQSYYLLYEKVPLYVVEVVLTFKKA